MASELTLSGTIDYSDSEGSSEILQVLEKVANVSTKKHVKHKMNVGLSEETISLGATGEITSPGWAIFINRDSTNFINLKVAASGAIFAKLLPGEFAMLRLGSGATAPVAIADTAACQMEYMIVST